VVAWHQVVARQVAPSYVVASHLVQAVAQQVQVVLHHMEASTILLAVGSHPSSCQAPCWGTSQAADKHLEEALQPVAKVIAERVADALEIFGAVRQLQHGPQGGPHR